MPAQVLWAEDEESDQFLIRSVLESNPDPPRIHFVGDGAAALAEATQHPHSLVVLDVNMPKVDGFQALQRLRADPAFAGVPVVMFSTSGSPEDEARSRQFGADYVQKPVQLDAFTEAVLAILERARR